MKVVIDIDDYDREWIANCDHIPDEINRKIAEVIIDGIPLPEHHGNLKDVNDIWNSIPDINVLTNHFTTYDIQHFIEDAPTIIEESDSK